MSPFWTLLPTHFWTTCGSFPSTAHTTYALCNTVYSFARYIATCWEKMHLISFTDLQSFPHTFQQPANLFNTLYTPPKSFTTFYNNLPTIHFQAKWSLLGLLVFIYLSIRTHDIGRSFEPIFMKFTRLVRVHLWVSPIICGNNRPNGTTDMGENVPPKPVFQV